MLSLLQLTALLSLGLICSDLRLQLFHPSVHFPPHSCRALLTDVESYGFAPGYRKTQPVPPDPDRQQDFSKKHNSLQDHTRIYCERLHNLG